MFNKVGGKAITWLTVICVIIWSLGLPFKIFIPTALASGGVNAVYMSDNMDIMITSTSTPYAVVKFDIWDNSMGTLSQLQVSLKDLESETGFDPEIDLLPLNNNAFQSGMSLWKDNDGDGQFNPANDIAASPSLSSWSYNGTNHSWTASFSSIGFTFPASTNLKVFLVFQAAEVATSGPGVGFQTIIPDHGMYVGGSSFNYWPNGYSHYFPPVWIGQEGAGGWGTPVVISEIMTFGSISTDEFVELYNRTDNQMDLQGWSVRYLSGTATTSLNWGSATIIYQFATSSPIQMPSGGYYLLGSGSVGTTTDVDYGPADILSFSGGYVGLLNPMNEIMDWVGYGTLSSSTMAEGGHPASAPPAFQSIERKAFQDSIYTMMITGGVDQYMGNSEDSNDNQADFIIRPSAEPQNLISPIEFPQGGWGGGGGSPLLINEIYYKTEAVNRWIELYNRSSDEITLTNFTLKHKSGWQFTFPSVAIASSSFMLIHWNQSGTNGPADIYTGSIGMDLDTYGGDLILKNDSGEIMDYVEYGGSYYANETEAVTDGQWMSGDYVPHCLYGQSIGRRSSDGEDWNDAGDWQTFSSPSPGYPNMGGDSTAPDPVANVSLIDNDSTAYSQLDGRDITVTWTPSATQDASFDRYEIFLLPSSTQIDWNSHKPIDCIYNGQYQYDSNNNPLSIYTYTGGSWITKDSAGTILTETSYIAYVISFDYYGNKSGVAQSSPYTPTSEAYGAADDHTPPFIMHMGVWFAYAGSNMHLLARIDDDRAIATTSPPLEAVWKVGSDFNFDLNSGVSTSTCNYIQSGFYDCTITWGGWTVNDVIGYYLVGLDDAGNIRYMSASPDADMSGNIALVKSHPFYIDIMSSPADGDSDPDLTGTTYSWDGNVLASTTVFFEGMAIAPATTNASGTFSFADNTLDVAMYHIAAFKDGYMDMYNTAYKGDHINFYLNEGDMNMMGGGGDDGNPHVMWTAPSDNMMGAPINIFCTSDCSTIGISETPIIIAFDRPMNSNTINDQNAADSGSNIYLTTDGNDRVNGKVYYDSNSNEARFYSSTPNTLSLSTYYSIVVTQGVTDEFGNPINGMNSDGSFSNGFTTIMSTSTDYNNFGTGGAMMPPYVMGIIPFSGQVNVPRSTSIVIKFSEPMDTEKINTNTIELRPVTNSTNWTLGSPVAAVVTLDQATRRLATLNPNSDMSALYEWWVIRIKGDARSSSMMYMADPMSVGGCADYTVCSELNAVTAYEGSFQVNVGAVDTTAPTVMGTYPSNNDGIISSSSAVFVGIGAIEIGFSEGMSPNTITSDTIKLLAGSSVTSAKVSFDPMSNNAKLVPYSALLSNTQYTLRITTACKDLSGNQLSATSSVYFKTGAADTFAPELMYANGDDYRIALTFTEPMNAAKQTDTTNWPYSVLNPANYAANGLVYSDPQSCSGSWSCNYIVLSPYDGAYGTSLSGLGLSFSYEEFNNTVIIQGFAFGDVATDFQIFVDNVRDKSNNIIADSGERATSTTHLNATRAPLYDSADTYGALGPGATDYTMDMGDMGMMQAGAWPKNAFAGQQSMYFIDIPTTKSIPVGGKIVITFPAGFDVTNAMADPYSPVNNDINEWNAGIVTIHSVIGNQSARTITIIATTSPTQTNDFLHMDIKGIVNSNIPKDFGTDGYMVDIKTFTGDGALLEAISTMPFFITEGGDLSISGNISGLSAGDFGTMTVYMGSPMTGHMETEITVDEAANPDGSYSFNNLPDGEYYVFTDPTVTINGNDYYGKSNSEPIWLNGASTTKNIILTPEASGGAPITIHLTGDFSTDGIADDVDIFAGSPNSFRVKTLSNVGNVTDATTTLYLSGGDWMVGIGPAMPKDMSGPPPMSDWMPPMNVYHYSDGSTPGAVNFNITGQSTTTISGTVVDGSSNPISDAEVYAYQPMGGYGGSFTRTMTDGTFTLKIPVLGTYMVGAHKPGLPEPKEIYVEVDANVTGVTIKIVKPPYTISGKVLNSSGNAVPYAPVWAWQENSWGHADTMTDATGNYILYVNPGTWHIEADAPGIGWMEYGLALTITDSSRANINISPAAGTTYYSISGTVGIDTNGTPSSIETKFGNMPIRAVKYNASTGVYEGKEFNSMTNSDGDYSISVPAGSYRVDIWTPEYGELGVNNQNNNNTLNESGIDDDYANNPANVDATASNVTDADIVVSQSGLRNVYITIANAPANQEGYLNIEGVDFTGGYPEPTGFHMFRRVTDLTATTTLRLADGDYFMFLDVPGYGGYIPDASDRHVTKDDIVISGTTTVHFTMPDLSSGVVTISGTVYAGSEAGGNELADAWVWIGQPSNGYHNGTVSASDGTYSIILPAGTGYRLGADKPGYMSDEPSSLNASASSTGTNIVLTQYSLTISGYIYADAVGGTSDQYDSGEGIPNGFVRAETTQCSDSDTSNDASCQRSHSPVDGAGFYQVGVTAGTWKVYGMADGYSETYYGSTISISGSSAPNRHIELSTNANWTVKSKNKAITPASGGSLDDTDPGGTGVKLTIPPNALGSSNSSGNVTTQKTSSITSTNSSDPVGGEGVTVTATDNSGQAITNLDDYIDMEMVLYKTDVEAAIAAEELTYAQLKNTKNGYWDSTTNDWVDLTTTRKAYYKLSGDTDWRLYSETGTSSTAFVAFVTRLSNNTLSGQLGSNPTDYKLVFSSKTNHLTVFAVIMPFVAVAASPDPDPDPEPDPPPTGGGGSVTSYCTSVEYGEWGECIGGVQTREVVSRSPSSCRLTTTQQVDQQRVCVLGEEEEAGEAEEGTDVQIGPTATALSTIDELYLDQGRFIERGEINEIMEVLGIVERNHAGEKAARSILTNILGINLEALALSVQYALTNFITYGSPDTYRLGSGERAGVLNSFMAAFGKVATTADDWSDVIKIANGRWPTQRSEEAEANATESFRKIYLRDPDRSKPHDDAAVTVIAYGLRPANRNMDSEAAAVRIFKAIYGYAPTSATDWDIVRAIAYSGAVR